MFTKPSECPDCKATGKFFIKKGYFKNKHNRYEDLGKDDHGRVDRMYVKLVKAQRAEVNQRRN